MADGLIGVDSEEIGPRFATSIRLATLAMWLILSSEIEF
jgi:hypothetical protein